MGAIFSTYDLEMGCIEFVYPQRVMGMIFSTRALGGLQVEIYHILILRCCSLLPDVCF